jgi:hypothetical protein
MAEQQKHGGMAAGLDGPVEVGSHIDLRQAVEDNLLDYLTAVVESAGSTRVHRAAVFRQAAEQFQDLRAQNSLRRSAAAPSGWMRFARRAPVKLLFQLQKRI